MNERFEKLLSQSWHECRKEQEVNDPARYYSDNGPNIDAVYEKFAELIVRECADVCSNVLDHHAILERFGVEE